MSEDLLFEVGSDEIPARYILSAIHDIKDRMFEALKGARLDFDGIESYGTPRRLVVYVVGLAEKSKDASTKVRGPSKKVAFDREGNPTKALLGFSRSLGIEPEDTMVEKESGGEYLYGFKHETGRPAEELLPEILPSVVLGMDCPHPLRWGEGDWLWYRPIRWLLCLLGDKKVGLEIAGIKSGHTSFGHRTLHPGEIRVPSAAEYFDVIKKAGVMVDHASRRQTIFDGAQALAKEVSGKPLLDERLLDEVTFLCEQPAPFRGEFSPEYLHLPEEVLVTVMRYHQRYFPLFSESGKVVPGFIGVRDGTVGHGMDNVKKGNQWVLAARLEDALFFYRQDLKVPLSHKLGELKGVYFLRGAGTLLHKVKRLEQITEFLGRSLGISGKQMELALEAARLAKCDLVTLLVRELPELEGIMGGHYARAEGADHEVAKAVSQHYMPRGAGDRLPDEGISALVALADKLDTLSVAFALGARVSGSQDPFGLRRAAYGVANIILSYGYDLSFDELLEFTLELGLKAMKDKGGANDEHEKVLATSLKAFILQRVEALLFGRGFPIEIIRGALGGGEARISRLSLMVEALASLSGSQDLDNIVTGWRRTSVLGSKAGGGSVDEKMLVEEPEKRLYHLIEQKAGFMAGLFEDKKYRRYLDELSSLRVPIDRCLDEVLIMTENEGLRQNRLNLLNRVSSMFTRFADFSHILPLIGKP